MHVELVDDPSLFLAATGAHLAASPARHNLILSLAHARLVHPVPGRYAWAHHRGRVVAVAFQSPLTFPFVLGPGPRAAVRALARALACVVPDAPGVTGEAPSASVFAGEWATTTRARVAPREAQRLFRATRVRRPRDVSGRLRRATTADLAIATEWVGCFQEEIGEPASAAHVRYEAERLVAERELWCWDDDGPVAITSATPVYEGVARVRHVYTPPERRRRGYASACAAGVTDACLAGGAASCVLFTQLTNPTSNAVYARLGYRPIAEMLRYRFER
jgi:predicted GNAT family acetyltransferase